MDEEYRQQLISYYRGRINALDMSRREVERQKASHEQAKARAEEAKRKAEEAKQKAEKKLAEYKNMKNQLQQLCVKIGSAIGTANRGVGSCIIGTRGSEIQGSYFDSQHLL